MNESKDQARGIDPNSATGTRDAVDPETGTVGTGGTPLTAGYGMSGSTVGTGSRGGREQQESGDYNNQAPGAGGYAAGQSERTEPIPAPKPSQAEGDRETIDQDIREKEASGEI